MKKTNSGLKEATTLFLVIVSGLGFITTSLHADGLELEEIISQKVEETPLEAPPPPRVEPEEDFLLPPPEPEAISDIEKAETPRPEPKKKDFWSDISQGMIIMKPGDRGTISASEDNKRLLGQGDIVYLSGKDKSLAPDQEWVVFKTIKDVRHPKTKASVGDLVSVLGMVRVIDVNEKVATARIERSKEPMSLGDRIALLDQFLPQPKKVANPLRKGDEAYVIEVREDRRNNAQHDIVYIDQGTENGVLPGDRFVVIHGGTRSHNFSETMISDESLPFRKIGTMVVLNTQARTATAKIIQSLEPITKGDTILFDSSR